MKDLDKAMATPKAQGHSCIKGGSWIGLGGGGCAVAMRSEWTLGGVAIVGGCLCGQPSAHCPLQSKETVELIFQGTQTPDPPSFLQHVSRRCVGCTRRTLAPLPCPLLAGNQSQGLSVAL